ncbi:hypothetical protein [Candidatus Hecatella orcuttiae]|uniref:hypothetical protein n=1 Tax=Candidatus Hecatella orcuttiae TaxID=1935119 RepID=UPI0028683108|nr:hypothetical protein [Candidatus Hecatella orcuttiae]
MRKPNIVGIAGAAVLAALSVTLQLLPPLFLTPWFMRIDFVAVPWILAWIFFGFRPAALSLLISVPLVGLLGPFAGGWVGAIMKSAASVWMIAVPAGFACKFGVNRLLHSKWLYALVGLVAVAVRDLATILFNLYFAIPVFFGMTVRQVVEFFSNPVFQSFVGLSLGAAGITAVAVEIAFWNSVQGFIDLYVALALGLAVLRRLKIRPAS